MKLAALVATSEEVAATRSRLEKSRHLSELLLDATPDEVPLVVTYLSARIPQGRVGVGFGKDEMDRHRGRASARRLRGSRGRAVHFAPQTQKCGEVRPPGSIPAIAASELP